MEQHQLLLTQNTAATGTGIEFTEKHVKLTQASILTGENASGGNPTVLTAAGGHIGRVLKVVDAGSGVPKLEFAEHSSHDQNTDTGTTSQTFQLHSGSSGGKLKAESATKFGLKNQADNAYVDLEAKDATFAKVTVSAAPDADTDLTNKLYVDGLLAANDAMIFKGTLGTGGTVTALPTTHDIGWTYKVVTAATYAGKVCEIGDMVISLVKRTGSGNANADWAVVQANIDGAVVKNGNLVDNSLVVGAGASSVKDLPLAANSVVVAITANTPSPLDVAASTFVGRGASGNVAALSAADARTILNVEDNANYFTYTHPTTAGNKHIPADGATTQILQWESDGTAKWVTVSGDVSVANNGAATIANKAVTFAKMQDSSADGFSVIGKTSTGAGAFDEIKATDNDTVLMRTGAVSSIGFGKIGNAQIDDNAAIAIAKLAGISPLRILGNASTDTSAVPAELESHQVNEILCPPKIEGPGDPVPASATAVGTKGLMAYDDNFVYRCIKTGTEGNAEWRRYPMAVWS